MRHRGHAAILTGYASSTNSHIVLVGLMGSGKTTVGRLLGLATARPFLDCDEELEQRVGRQAADIAAEDGLDALHALEAEVLLDSLRAESSAVISAAASTIEDERCREALSDVFVVWLRAGTDVLVARAKAENHRPLADDAAAQLTAQAQRRDPLFEAVADYVVEVDSTMPFEVVELVSEQLAPVD